MVIDRRIGESEETEAGEDGRNVEGGEEEGVEAGAGTEPRRRWKVLLDEMRYPVWNEKF
jgi:hypothetical protein